MFFQRSAIFFALFALFSTSFTVLAAAVEKRTARTSPPTGSYVVKASGATTGQYSTVQAAVNALPNDSTDQVIFIYAGTYTEQVYITRTGKTTIYGATSDTSSYTSNTVTIAYASSAAAAGSDDLSGTLRVHKDNFFLYNVNVKNTYGIGSQALALSAYGTQHGYYGVGFYGYQDTVLAETGKQFYGKCYIEGAVDYIFGQHAYAYFRKPVIASRGAGAITADGPASSTDGLFVIDQATIQQSSAATTSLTGKVFLGRPWSEYATVVYTNSVMSSIINSAGWEQWSTTTPNTAYVKFYEYNSSGAGASGTRASFSKNLTSATGYGAADVLGSTWTTWVDQSYV